jgi:hypothetical protein
MIVRSFVRLAVLASLFAVPAAQAQAPAVPDSGIAGTPALMRVSLYRYADGQNAAANADMRQHLIPIWEAYKAAGIIVNYSTMTNATQNSKDDWQFGIVFTYKNYAALDSLGARQAAITLKHYGTAAARTAANEARGKLRTLVSSNLINAMTYARR